MRAGISRWLARALTAVRHRNRALRGVALVLAGVDRGTRGSSSCGESARAAEPPLISFAGTIRRMRRCWRSTDRAAALVYPSRYEGFGLPLLEAMSCGRL